MQNQYDDTIKSITTNGQNAAPPTVEYLHKLLDDTVKMRAKIAAYQQQISCMESYITQAWRYIHNHINTAINTATLNTLPTPTAATVITTVQPPEGWCQRTITIVAEFRHQVARFITQQADAYFDPISVDYVCLATRPHIYTYTIRFTHTRTSVSNAEYYYYQLAEDSSFDTLDQYIVSSTIEYS